jgi:hypothetical protein
MKILTGLMIVVYSVLIAIGLAHSFRVADSVTDAIETLHLQLRETLRQLCTWAAADLWALSAGLMEGFLWQRQQVFAGFYRTVFHLSLPVATAMVLTVMLLPVAESWRPVLFVGLWTLSFALGLTLLAGRPLVR